MESALAQWKHRSPPRGLTSDECVLCDSWKKRGICRMGISCSDAHGEDELHEWKLRIDQLQGQILATAQPRATVASCNYIEKLQKRIANAASERDIITNRIDTSNMSVNVTSQLSATCTKDSKHHNWKFMIESLMPLQHTALLNDDWREHFKIENLLFWTGTRVCTANIPINCQEANVKEHVKNAIDMQQFRLPWKYEIEILFKVDMYGKFEQSLVLDFGVLPVVAFTVVIEVKSEDGDVLPDEAAPSSDKKLVTADVRWTMDNCNIVPFDVESKKLADPFSLVDMYPVSSQEPARIDMIESAAEINAKNYMEQMHHLLTVEECAESAIILEYGVKSVLKVVKSYITVSTDLTTKYALPGELYGSLSCDQALSEDSSAGKLILSNCTSLLLCRDGADGKKTVYDCPIEDKGKNTIYIRLSAGCIDGLGVKPDDELSVIVQFQLNRLPFCEMHYAVDKIVPDLLFPDVSKFTIAPWDTEKQWNKNLDPKLNAKQKEAILAITTNLKKQLPPVLIIGPFGTGKTFTLAQAIQEIVSQPGTRVLVCTHSNSAADIYVKDYLHKWVEEGNENIRPLRVYYHGRWVATVHPTVLEYCLTKVEHQQTKLVMPTVQDLKKYKVVISTLSTSGYLAHLGLEKGFFTHILLDEAAQIMECEAIIPLALAGKKTRIVLAGDHMQMSPEVYSEYARKRGMHISLLERFYDLYPNGYPCRLLLCENYRSRSEIIAFASNYFYDRHLTPSSKQPRHDDFYPIAFFAARGEDKQDPNSLGFFNNAEVHEVVDRVMEIRKNWPESWGSQDDDFNIGVITPYSDQVARIRTVLRRKRVKGVTVERVLNVQGKQFRVVMISTVRTQYTCDLKREKDANYGFLSNMRLLNTAITRAQSLIAVVGDPVAMCSIGQCRKLWEHYIETCAINNSLYGLTWAGIQVYLKGLDKKLSNLNPLAPEFIPTQIWCPYTNKPLNEPVLSHSEAIVNEPEYDEIVEEVVGPEEEDELARGDDHMMSGGDMNGGGQPFDDMVRAREFAQTAAVSYAGAMSRNMEMQRAPQYNQPQFQAPSYTEVVQRYSHQQQQQQQQQFQSNGLQNPGMNQRIEYLPPIPPQMQNQSLMNGFSQARMSFENGNAMDLQYGNGYRHPNYVQGAVNDIARLLPAGVDFSQVLERRDFQERIFRYFMTNYGPERAKKFVDYLNYQNNMSRRQPQLQLQQEATQSSQSNYNPAAMARPGGSSIWSFNSEDCNLLTRNRRAEEAFNSAPDPAPQNLRMRVQENGYGISGHGMRGIENGGLVNGYHNPSLGEFNHGGSAGVRSAGGDSIWRGDLSHVQMGYQNSRVSNQFPGDPSSCAEALRVGLNLR